MLVNGSAAQLERWISVQLAIASHQLPRQRHGDFLQVRLNLLFSVSVDSKIIRTLKDRVKRYQPGTYRIHFH